MLEIVFEGITAGAAALGVLAGISVWLWNQTRKGIKVKKDIVSSTFHGKGKCNFARLKVKTRKSMRARAEVVDLRPSGSYEPVPFNLHWARSVERHEELDAEIAELELEIAKLGTKTAPDNQLKSFMLEHQRRYHYRADPIVTEANSWEPLDLVMHIPASHPSPSEFLYIADYRWGTLNSHNIAIKIEIAGNDSTKTQWIKIWLENGNLKEELINQVPAPESLGIAPPLAPSRNAPSDSSLTELATALREQVGGKSRRLGEKGKVFKKPSKSNDLKFRRPTFRANKMEIRSFTAIPRTERFNQVKRVCPLGGQTLFAPTSFLLPPQATYP